MKRISFVIAAIALVVLASCKKDEGIKYLSSNLTIDESALDGAPSPSSYDVTFENVNTAYTRTKASNGTSVSVDSLVSGVYNITVQATFSNNGFAYNYIGSAQNVEITADGVDCSVAVSATKASALVLKELFYNCSVNSTTGKGAYIKDNFYEVYNNSDQTVYADGLCIGEVLSNITYTWDQSDFSKVSDYTGNPEDYVFMATLVWQIPGDGSTYPIEPGESIVIAASAINHTEVNAASPNLSTAEFEAYCDHYGEKGQTDAEAPNMTLAVQVKAPTNQWLISNQGRGIIIFYPTHALRNQDFIAATNYSTTFGLEVLRSDIVDAVDCVKTETTNKWLPETLDAGKIWCSGINKGESVSRKVVETGKYQDTNNTSSDFEVNTTAEIRRNGAKRPSWSTWGE